MYYVYFYEMYQNKRYRNDIIKARGGKKWANIL